MMAAKSFIQNSYGASCYCGHSCSFHTSVVIAAVVNMIITDVVLTIVMVIFIAIMKIICPRKTLRLRIVLPLLIVLIVSAPLALVFVSPLLGFAAVLAKSAGFSYYPPEGLSVCALSFRGSNSVFPLWDFSFLPPLYGVLAKAAAFAHCPSPFVLPLTSRLLVLLLCRRRVISLLSSERLLSF